MKISLIIPAYNEEKYIKACLESVSRAILPNGQLAEIIVVDNASTDRTAEVAKNFPKVRVVSEKEKGLTKARARGLLESSGDIIAYIDGDTRVGIGWFQKIIDEFESDSELVCLSGPYRYYDLGRFDTLLVKFYWNILALPIYFLLGYMVVGGNFAAKKSALEAIGGFDKNINFYGEDTNIARRLHRHGKVKFSTSFPMETSARRFRSEGLLRIAFTYALNFAGEVIFHRSLTKVYKDVR